MNELMKQFPHLFTDEFKRELSTPTHHCDGVTRRANAAKLKRLEQHFNGSGPDSRTD
jgi:hypothetical protein